LTIRTPLLALATLALVAACAPTPPSARGINKAALDSTVGAAIGDPSTCLLLADRASGRVVYRYGDHMQCDRPLPACDRPGTLGVDGALALAAQPGGWFASCASVPDGSRRVGWAAARAPMTRRDLVYAARMEGERALPGREINARLADAFLAARL